MGAGRSCGASAPLSCGMASGVTQPCRRARTSQRHRDPADISGGDGLRPAAVGGPVIRANRGLVIMAAPVFT